MAAMRLLRSRPPDFISLMLTMSAAFRLATADDHEPSIRGDVVRPTTENGVHCKFEQHLRTPGDERRPWLHRDRKDLPTVAFSRPAAR